MAKAKIYGAPRSDGILHYGDGIVRCTGWQRRIKVLRNAVGHLNVFGLPANGSTNDLQFVKS